jgi:hypothetical protein
MNQPDEKPKIGGIVDSSEEKPESLWSLLFGTVFMGGAAVYLYSYLTDLETKGGEDRVHWLIALLYNIGGKNLTVGLFAVLAVLFFIWFVVRLVQTLR